MKTVLVTGANRGIGEELCRQFIDEGFWVIGAGRSEEELEKLKARFNSNHLETVVMDISSIQSIMRATGELRDKTIDILINNAGELSASSKLEDSDPAETMRILNTNFTGSVLVARAFVKQLQKSEDPRIINVSSGMGSRSELGFGYGAYRLSKAALNLLTIQMDQENFAGAKVFSVCPGWVKTRMGGSGASLSVAKGAEGIVWLANSPDAESGKFYRDKHIIPW
ncbi:MAG: SDR family NAD(P)-dependent oxidoreductase [Bacteroidetes bacterium]|nr:SDR family NAD(P)-dependent oxidoreductase [Bacteroidota bacterium]